jgi:hypothetical protein
LSPHALNYSGDPAVAVSQHGVGLPVLLIPAAVLSDDPRLMRIEMILVAVALAYPAEPTIPTCRTPSRTSL